MKRKFARSWMKIKVQNRFPLTLITSGWLLLLKQLLAIGSL